MSIVFRKFIKISPPEFGGNDKKEKQKKSGNRGFVEFPRPLTDKYGGPVGASIGIESDWTVEKGTDGLWEVVDIYELA